MKTCWLLAKYLPDYRRKEPRNIGVILIQGGSIHSKFLWNAPRFVQSKKNYGAWIESWHRDMATAASCEEFLDQINRIPASNYYLEKSGERMCGGDEDPIVFLEWLFRELVEVKS